MFATELQKELASFLVTEDKAGSLLIDGPWGCGKTYAINEFFENGAGKSITHFYCSLFGVPDSDSLVLRLAGKLDPKNIRIVNGHYFVESGFRARPYNRAVIVFDDLERKSRNLLFEELFGIIDALVNNGFKVIAVINSEQIGNESDPQSVGAFTQFKERAFDRIVSMKADPGFVMEHLSINAETAKICLDTIDDNLRTVIKAERYLENIRQEMATKNRKDLPDKMGLNSDDLSLCLVCALHFELTPNDKTPVFKSEDLKKIEYQDDVDRFGEDVANHLNVFLQKNQEKARLRWPIKAAVNLVKTGDYEAFFAVYYPPEKEAFYAQPPFDLNPFYYDDQGREKYRMAFLAKLAEFDFSEKYQMRLLGVFLGAFGNSLSTKEVQEIANQVKATVTKDKSPHFFQELFGFEEYNESTARIRNAFESAIAEKEKETLEETVQQLLTVKNWRDLTSFLYKNRQLRDSEKLTICSAFQKRDYLLPDLAKQISPDEWEYCHEIAIFVNPFERHKAAFIELLRNQCRKSGSDILRIRCQAIGKYDFNEKLALPELDAKG